MGSSHSYKLYYCAGGRGGQKRPKNCVHTKSMSPDAFYQPRSGRKLSFELEFSILIPNFQQKMLGILAQNVIFFLLARNGASRHILARSGSEGDISIRY